MLIFLRSLLFYLFCAVSPCVSGFMCGILYRVYLIQDDVNVIKRHQNDYESYNLVSNIVVPVPYRVLVKKGQTKLKNCPGCSSIDLPATFLVFPIFMLEIPFRILSFCLDGEPFAFCEFVSVATFVGITFCVYLLALPFSCQHFLYHTFSFFQFLFLFSFCCSSYLQVCCQLRFVFANHYYLHLRNFLFLRLRKKDI